MNLQEIHDSEIPDLLERQPWGWIGQFRWGEQTFTVQLGQRAVSGTPRDWKIFEASFFRTDVDGDDAFSTYTGSEEVPVKVYGVVLNALRRVWQEADLDAIFFTAEPRHSKDADQHERKERIYGYLAQRIFRGDGGYLYVHRGNIKAATEWLVTRQPLSSSYWTNALKEGIDELLSTGYVIKSI